MIEEIDLVNTHSFKTEQTHTKIKHTQSLINVYFLNDFSAVV